MNYIQTTCLEVKTKLFKLFFPYELTFKPVPQYLYYIVVPRYLVVFYYARWWRQNPIIPGAYIYPTTRKRLQKRKKMGEKMI